MESRHRTVHAAAWAFALTLGLATGLTTALVRSGTIWQDPSFQASLLAVPFIAAAVFMKNSRRAGQVLVAGMALAAWFFTWRLQGSGYFVGNYAYLVVIVVAAAFLLRPRETTAYAAANIVVIILVWRLTELSVSDLVLSLVYQIMFSGLLVGLANHLHRARTEAEQLADDLGQAHEGLQLLLGQSWDGLVRLDPDGIKSNACARDWFTVWHGAGPASMAIEDLFPGAPVAAWRAEAAAAGQAEGECTIETRIGPRELKLRWIGAQIAGNEAVFIRDVTDERRQAEAERERVRQDAELARMREQRAWQTRFLNMAGHELRTPMTPIRLHLDMVRHQMDGESFDVLDRNMRRLQHLIDEVLEMVRLEQDRLPIHPEPTDLSALVTQHAQMWARVAAAKGLSLELDIAPGVHATCDPRRTGEVIDNLLSNATKYTAEGGIRVGLGVDHEAVVTVADTGMGFSAEDRAKVFEPFGRLPQHQAVQGTGLGMAIAQELASRMGGSLDGTSPGRGLGATFTMRLPVIPSSSQPLESAPHSA